MSPVNLTAPATSTIKSWSEWELTFIGTMEPKSKCKVSVTGVVTSLSTSWNFS